MSTFVKGSWRQPRAILNKVRDDDFSITRVYHSDVVACREQDNSNEHPLIRSPLKISTSNPQMLTTDTLYKITNRVLNPWREYMG